MPTSPSTIAFILDAVSGRAEVTARKMFGEYGLFIDGKMAAVVCGDQLFVKPTAEGRRLAAGASDAPPYPGAKPYLLIDADRLEDREWASLLLTATAAALPAPKPRRAPGHRAPGKRPPGNRAPGNRVQE